MQQNPLFSDDIYDAVRDAVQALGGSKRVGALLWPAKPVQDAGKYLDRCLDSERAEKLSLDEFELIVRRSAERQCHTVASHLGRVAGYEFRAVSVEDKRDALQREFIQASKAMERVAQQLKGLEG